MHSSRLAFSSLQTQQGYVIHERMSRLGDWVAHTFGLSCCAGAAAAGVFREAEKC